MSTTASLPVLSFSGSFAAMGEAFGEACRDPIRALYRLRVDNALTQAASYGGRTVGEEALLRVAEASWAETQRYDPDGAEELAGIARGSGLSVLEVLAMNGLTDFRDVLAWHGDLEALGGCSAVIAQRDATREGELICAQTWDLASDNMPFVIGVHRRPERGPETWCLTTVGCLSLIGMNAHGLAVGTTNLRTTDARPGVGYLSMIHKALGASTLEEAALAISGARRAGAHFYFLCDAAGRAVTLECTAHQVARREVSSGIAVHTNHCLTAECARLEGAQPTASSHARQARLETWLGERAGTIDVTTLKVALADRSGGELAVCRDDTGGISTNGAVVMRPETGVIEACHGLPPADPAASGRWVDLRSPP